MSHILTTRSLLRHQLESARLIRYEDTGVAVAGAIVTTPSPLTAPVNAVFGTAVGTLSVSGGIGTYTFSLSVNAGGKYTVVGNQIQVAGLLTIGTDLITIVADNGAGSVFALVTTVAVTSTSAGADVYPYLLV